jgi:hypothetical protein
MAPRQETLLFGLGVGPLPVAQLAVPEGPEAQLLVPSAAVMVVRVVVILEAALAEAVEPGDIRLLVAMEALTEELPSPARVVVVVVPTAVMGVGV